MPNTGDKLHLVWNGGLETVTFLWEERNVPIPNLPAEGGLSYLCEQSDGKSGKRRFLCAPDMYVTTELEAWRRYRGQCQDAITAALKGLEEAEKHVEYVKDQTHKANMEISRLSPLVGGAKSDTETRA